MRCFGIDSNQEEQMTFQTNADDKLGTLAENFFLRHDREQYDDKFIQIERSSFASTSSSVQWTETAASPICSFYASYLQQNSSHIKDLSLVEQNNILRKLKKHGTTIMYPRITDNKNYKLSTSLLADASKGDSRG